MADKGVIVEFDFAVLDGAERLFGTVRDFLQKLDNIPFDARVEAQHFAGCNYQGALAEYFSAVKTKKTAVKATKDIVALFGAQLNEAVPKAVSPAFRKYVTGLVDAGARVVISTRADLDAVRSAFDPILSDRAVLYHEESMTYGCVKWDAWRRACVANRLRTFSTVAVTGSGLGVKAALFAGLPAIGVLNDRVAYQDFSGADEVVRDLGAQTLRKTLEILRLG